MNCSRLAGLCILVSFIQPQQYKPTKLTLHFEPELLSWNKVGENPVKTTTESMVADQPEAVVSRKDKRKALKKEKRKLIRKEVAEKSRADEEARLNDPEVQRQIQLEEERENERLERERKEFEERERIFLQELEERKKKKNDAETESTLLQLEEGAEEVPNEDDEWEYVEEGPPEIIWQGNEITVKKNKVRVKKKDDTNQETIQEEDPNRPTSNPLPPQHEAYAAFKNAPMTTSLDAVAQQVPNFGTEQDKAHCPFHIKTGACRFGLRCNRVHYYPDKSNTLLIKNMYNGPGLAWDQDEGLENFPKIHSGGSWFEDRREEEVERNYEEFYEDVHTEFLKFGEIINFKVCRNGSFHLRGNVYVHYKSLDSAVMAYNSVHGRYFAGKQVKCEFVSLTRWKVAICGEYMKSRLKTCSRGSACNFLHCFSNPGGDYEWADCDKPPPRYWVNNMTALFGGYSDHEIEDQSHSTRIFTSDRDDDSYKGHRSSQHNGSSGRSSYREETPHRHREQRQQGNDVYEEDEMAFKNNNNNNNNNNHLVDDGYNHYKRHRSSQHNGSSSSKRSERDIRRESKSRHRTPDSRRGSSSSDEEHAYMKRRKSRNNNRNNISESSSNDAKIENKQKTRRRSRHSDYDRQESKKVEGGRSRGRSRSQDNMSDRWQPSSDHSSKLDDNAKAYEEIYDHDWKPNDHETRSDSIVVEDTSKEIQHHGKRTTEKRKRI